MDQITIVFAGINDHVQSRGLLSRLREQSTADLAVWLEIKDVLESMREIMVVLKVPENTHEASVCLSTGYAQFPDALSFVYAITTLLSEGKYHVIKPGHFNQNVQHLVRYLIRHERIERRLDTHASVGQISAANSR